MQSAAAEFGELFFDMSMLRRAYMLFELMHRQQRELERKDLVLRLDMGEQVAANILGRLKAAKCIEFAYGNCRRGVFYRFLPGSKLPPDGRGKSENSRKALQRRAARPSTSVATWKKPIE